MNNKQENRELQQATPTVTPPPFRQQEENHEPLQEPATSPTLAERIAALGLDDEAASLLNELTSSLESESVTPELLHTLAQGVTHATDVQNADATGYLRGRNEKIEAVLHPDPEDADEETLATPVFPRYCRRSIWD